MFCTNCGKEVEAGSRFCPSCGHPVAGTGPDPAAGFGAGYGAGAKVPPPRPAFFTPRTPQLVRPRHPRAIAGVCAAFALHYGWDLTLVRIITVLVSLFWGFGVLAYIICWIAIPEAQFALPPNGDLRS